MILGEGPLRSQLKTQAEELNLSGRVEFAGALSDPFPIVMNSDLFVFSSRYEGFGNALCEAMVCGLPVISFGCPAGPPEIVRNGVDGVLMAAGDVDRWAITIRRLCEDTSLIERLRENISSPRRMSSVTLPMIATLESAPAIEAIIDACVASRHAITGAMTYTTPRRAAGMRKMRRLG